MSIQINEYTDIEGLYWKKNFFVGTGINSFTLVSNEGPIISDFLFFEDDSYFKNFSLQIGQIDRYTFIGKKDDVIKAEFIDCREHSPTLHQKVTFEFTPDPKKHLVIERGIAKRFTGFSNTIIRSEPILYAPSKDNDYNVGNDRIYISENSNEFPVVSVNVLPLPKEALQFLLKKEQEVIKKNKQRSFSVDTFFNGEKKRINLKSKKY
ncbi:dTDP-4-dehydrorhamnose 3,5-epimerase [Bacillus thuringiensis]|uniref:dTDP-4-dehydrorhamnose 3,5-epimerase n=1 Tax=Bacillus thuringiensis TaxID=1428 RepID=UPI000BF5D201|nr:dTDP-4-dehydrorhamnose 3,5-epimerase [Bacillus thuringiensis]PFR36723.1 dTDP-4-dehydrorhamnose 3,5-epimerase [Bacillus thuringiensis]